MTIDVYSTGSEPQLFLPTESDAMHRPIALKYLFKRMGDLLDEQYN